MRHTWRRTQLFQMAKSLQSTGIPDRYACFSAVNFGMCRQSYCMDFRSHAAGDIHQVVASVGIGYCRRIGLFSLQFALRVWSAFTDTLTLEGVRWSILHERGSYLRFPIYGISAWPKEVRLVARRGAYNSRA